MKKEGTLHHEGIKTINDKIEYVKSYPVAKKLAMEYGIDISLIEPSLNGIVTKEDVLKYIKSFDEVIVENHPPTIAEGRNNIPQNLINNFNMASAMVEVDMNEIFTLRKKMNSRFHKDLYLVSFLSKALADALKKYPIFNSTSEGENCIINNQINLGVVMSLEQGIIVPVIMDLDKKDIYEISMEVNSLSQKAQNGELEKQETQGATITLSNSGKCGAIFETPIIIQPQSCILWTGKITKRVTVIEDDKIEIRPIMYLVLAYNPRIIDCTQSSSFLNHIKDNLENPIGLVFQM